MTNISISGKKTVIDEITENLVILYFGAGAFEGEQVIGEMIARLAVAKAKEHPGLSNKSIFKFMDMQQLAV
jgi:hypothetical protein